MTLEQYARFCAERTLWPQHQAEVCAKYGVPADSEKQVHDKHRQMFANDSDLAMRFNELYQKARAELDQQAK